MIRSGVDALWATLDWSQLCINLPAFCQSLLRNSGYCLRNSAYYTCSSAPLLPDAFVAMSHVTVGCCLRACAWLAVVPERGGNLGQDNRDRLRVRKVRRSWNMVELPWNAQYVEEGSSAFASLLKKWIFCVGLFQASIWTMFSSLMLSRSGFNSQWALHWSQSIVKLPDLHNQTHYCTSTIAALLPDLLKRCRQPSQHLPPRANQSADACTTSIVQQYIFIKVT